jgi:hypothetical protein
MYLSGTFNQILFQNAKGKRNEGLMKARRSGEVSRIWKNMSKGRICVRLLSFKPVRFYFNSTSLVPQCIIYNVFLVTKHLECVPCYKTFIMCSLLQNVYNVFLVTKHLECVKVHVAFLDLLFVTLNTVF